MEAKTVTDIQYYDNLYRKMIAEPESEGWAWIKERAEFVAQYVVGESVLDLGCGFAVIADMVEAFYFGIDWSRVSIDWNRENVKNDFAAFLECGIGDWLDWKRDDLMSPYDTVMLLDVLEHLPSPKAIIDQLEGVVGQRLIVTVPRDMAGRAHIHPVWSVRQLEKLLGEDVDCELFGGPNGDRWWLATVDV